MGSNRAAPLPDYAFCHERSRGPGKGPQVDHVNWSSDNKISCVLAIRKSPTRIKPASEIRDFIAMFSHVEPSHRPRKRQLWGRVSFNWQ